MTEDAVLCPYCGNEAELIDSIVIYGQSYGMIWLCKPCDAYVGTHKNSPIHKPLGSLANRELRRWRRYAHLAFDPLWLAKMKKGYSKTDARHMAHQWLADEMGIDVEHCHISWFGVAECKQVIEICKPYLNRRQTDGT